jgi:preprotein translocase subunit SecE
MEKRTISAPGFFGDLMEELKKVSWPTRAQTVRLTLIVIGISLIIGLYIGIIDVALAKVLEGLTKAVKR